MYCVQQCVRLLAIVALSVRTTFFSKTSPPSSQIEPIVTNFGVFMCGLHIFIFFSQNELLIFRHLPVKSKCGSPETKVSIKL
jgi:hypothetical protein